MKKTTLITSALALSLGACSLLDWGVPAADYDPQQAAAQIEALDAQRRALTEELLVARSEGRISEEKAQGILSEVYAMGTQVESIRASFDAAGDGKVNVWQLLAAMGAVFFARGIPSKGPLREVGTLAGSLLTKVFGAKKAPPSA